MKQLGVFLLPLDGILVQCRVTPNINFAGTHLYTWVERGTVRIKCLAQKLNIISRPGLEPGLHNQETRLATSWPFLIYHPQAKREGNFEWWGREGGASDVSRKRSTCFTCRNVNQSVNFWREKHDWHFWLFMCSARDHRESRKWFPTKRLRVLFPNSNSFICVQCSMKSTLLTKQKLFHRVKPPEKTKPCLNQWRIILSTNKCYKLNR